MKALFVLVALTSNLMALDISTLDGKTFADCRVSRVFPDSICVLFSGGGARVRFTNLPTPVRTQFGYDPERAAAFERAEAVREARERASLAAQQQSAAQRRAASVPNQPPGSQTGGNTGSEYVGVSLAPQGAAANNQTGNRNGNQSGNGYSSGGAQYVGVRLAGPGGGIRGVTIPTPTLPRPYGF